MSALHALIRIPTTLPVAFIPLSTRQAIYFMYFGASGHFSAITTRR